MGEVKKGVILTIEGEKDRNDNYTMARVKSLSGGEAPTLPIVIPWYLRGKVGQLDKGTEIVFALFEDASGVILSRADGNWTGQFEEKDLKIDLKDNICYVQGQIQTL